MKKIKINVLVFSALVIFFAVFSSFSNEKQNIDVIILKLMGKELESAYVINDGKETKVRAGLTGDEALESYLFDGYHIEGTSVASDAGRFSVVYTLAKTR